MSFQQSSNEGPYQQPPVMSPRPTGSVDFQGAIKAQENRSYVIAGAGALLALISYLLFPVWGYSYNGAGASFIPASERSASIKAGSINDIGGIYGLTWLVLIASIVALAVVAVILFAPRAVAQLTPRLAAIILTACGVVSVFLLLLDWLKLNSYKGLFASAGSGFSAGTSWGMYVLILASIALLVGGIMQLRRSPAM